MGALLAVPAGRAGGWAAGVRAPTAADGGISTSHALLGACGGAAMHLSGLQVLGLQHSVCGICTAYTGSPQDAPRRCVVHCDGLCRSLSNSAIESSMTA